MHSFGSLFVLCLLVLQTLQITSMVPPPKIPDNDIARLNVARRLRAPLMGRSVGFLSPNESSEDIDLAFDKRRLNRVFLGRRRMVNPKRRGPLFG